MDMQPEKGATLEVAIDPLFFLLDTADSLSWDEPTRDSIFEVT